MGERIEEFNKKPVHFTALDIDGAFKEQKDNSDVEVEHLIKEVEMQEEEEFNNGERLEQFKKKPISAKVEDMDQTLKVLKKDSDEKVE